MKAIIYQGFGSPDILRCQEIEKPTPKDNEVLIKVRAASVNPLDWKLMKGGPFLVRILLARQTEGETTRLVSAVPQVPDRNDRYASGKRSQ